MVDRLWRSMSRAAKITGSVAAIGLASVGGLDSDVGGKVLSTQAFGKGAALGGMASDGRHLFAPISDPIQKPGDEGSPGLNALDIFTGKVLWQVAAKGGAIDAQSIAAGNGMVFVGSGYGQFAQTPGTVLVAFRPAAGARAAR